jgi:hypothetical protein
MQTLKLKEVLQPNVRYASACRELPQVQFLSGKQWHEFLEEVESAATPDKLKHIGHSVAESS